MKKPTPKSMQNRCIKLWKEYCYLRDGRECQVKRYFPEIAMSHTTVFQVDHCISRSNKQLFFDTRNGTVVCSACNAAKNFKNKSVDRAIDSIAIQREGLPAYDEMVGIDQKLSANVNFSRMWWLAEQIEQLEKKLEGLKRGEL